MHRGLPYSAAASQHTYGGAVERSELARVLAGNAVATTAARLAVSSGASYVVWDGLSSADVLVGIYGRRLRHTLRTGQRTLDLEKAVEQLRRCDQPLLMGQINDGEWVFMIFIRADSQTLVACTGVKRHPRPLPAPEPRR